MIPFTRRPTLLRKLQDTTASTLSSSFLKLSQDIELQELLREKLQGPEGESDLVLGAIVGCVLLHSVAPTISSLPKRKTLVLLDPCFVR